MISCTVAGINLADHGFGKWNTFHSGHHDLNEAFNTMYYDHDYSNPAFAITTQGFMTDDHSDQPGGQSTVELLTVADHAYFADLLQQDKALYRKKIRETIDSILDFMTPTTNERYCWSPEGNCYGSNMTPGNIGLRRLTQKSSI